MKNGRLFNFIFFILALAMFSGLASADCFGDGYGLKIPVLINMSANNTNYSYNFTLTNQTGMATDWSDIKIYNGLETVSLPFFILDNASTSANITIKGNYTTDNGTQAFICYNKTQAYLGDCGKSFEFCDDFLGTGSINATTWSKTGALTDQLINGILIVNGTNTGYQSTEFYHKLSGMGANYIIVSKFNVSPAIDNYGRISGLGITNTTDNFDSSKNALYFNLENSSFATIKNYNVQVFSGGGDGGRQLSTGTSSTNTQVYKIERTGNDFNFTVEATNLGVYTHNLIDTNPYIEILINMWSQSQTYRAINYFYVYAKNSMVGTTSFALGTPVSNPTIILNISSPTNATHTLDYHNPVYPLNFSATGNTSAYSCNYSLDGSLIGTTNATNNTIYSFNLSGLAFGQHNTTVACNNSFSSGNATTWFRAVYDSEMAFNSSNGWNLYEGQATTLTCSGAVPMNLSVNSIRVANPYSLTGTNGLYIVDCYVADPTNFTNTHGSQNLVINKYVACFNQSTYGFEINFTGLGTKTSFNFTALVNASLVRADLGDVWVQNLPDANVSINSTGGYYLNVDHTGLNNITVRFTNYAVNKGYSEAAPNTNISNVTNYTQIYPVVSIRLADEINDTNTYPTNTTVTAVLECSRGENFMDLNSSQTTFAFSGLNYYSRIAVIVKYSSTVYYSRQRYLLNQSGLNYLDFYVVDAYAYALDRVDFKMLDSSRYGSLLRLYKSMGNESKIINEGYFDASHFNSVYLIEDLTYYVQTLLSGSITDFGTMVITAPGEKDLSKTVLELNPNALLIADHLTMNAYIYNVTPGPDVNLRVIYDDDTHLTDQVNITVYYENGSIFQNLQYNDTDSVDIEFNVSSYPNQSFRAVYKIHHQIFGNSPVEYAVSIIAGFFVLPGLPTLWAGLISLFSVISIGAIASRRTIVGSSILMLVGMFFFIGIGWLTISWIAVVFIAVLLFLGILYYFKIGGT